VARFLLPAAGMSGHRKFHLAWFLNFTVDEWNKPHAGLGGNPWDGRFYVDVAQALERACFDFMLIEDKLAVPDIYGGSMEFYLRHALSAPKHDPAPLATLIGGMTRHLGVVATLSTLSYPPYLLARLCSTIDHIAHGRFGWNIVTSAENLAARNFGLEVLPPREQRYEMADEYLQVVNALFASWDKDAIILDRERRIYADPTKVRTIDFAGKYFKVRGPLNTAPSPQHRPVYVQAGASPRGRDFAAKYAEVVLGVGSGVAEMKAFRDDIRERARSHGRAPDDVKVMFLISPVVAASEAQARERLDEILGAPDMIEYLLAFMSSITDIDFSPYPVDEPLPHRLVTNGESGTLDAFQQSGSGKTLRQLAVDFITGSAFSAEMVGSYRQVAEAMRAAMAEVGGDGFLITSPTHQVGRRYVTEICEGLVPELQRLESVRTHYTGDTLRDHLRQY